MVLPAAMLAMGLAGCGGEDSDTEATGETCAYVITTTPGANATGVYYRSAVEAKFSPTLDASATLAVDGVEGSTSTRGNTLVFTPSAPMASSTTYTATLTSSCGTSTFSFTTSDIGAEVTADLAGKTYALDLQSDQVRFVNPEGVGDLLGQYLTTDILVGVASPPTTQIQMLGAIGLEEVETPTQDICTQTIPFPVADFSENPFFEVGPETTTINVQDFAITINDLRISGSFAADASEIAGATLSGKIDTRPLVPLLDPEGEDDAICVLAQSIGVTCEACADGSGNFCLSLDVVGIPAVEVPGPIVELVDQAAVCAQEECAAEAACTETTPQ
jgi:hypothetical protein